MAEKKKGAKRQQGLLIVSIAFICGFVAGVAFTVFRLDTGPPVIASQQNEESKLTAQQSEAITNLESKVKETPGDYQSWVALGHLYFDTNQPQKAIEAYNTSLELHDGDANLYTDLGVMYRRLDQPEKAVEMFDRAIEMDEIHQYSRLNKGIVLLYDLNRPDEAFASWESVLQLNPEAQVANGELLRDVMKAIKAEIEKMQ